MSDDASRRERRQFEPPPWERDQFEAIARRRAEEEAREAAAEAARLEAAREAARVLDAARASAEGEAEAPSAAAGPDDGPAVAAGEAPAALDEKKLDVMMIQLSGEEPSAVGGFRKAGGIAAWVIGACGTAMLGFGVVMLVKTGEEGMIGSSLIALTGSIVIGFAVWLGFRAGQR